MTQHASYIAGVEYNPPDMLQRENDWVNPGVLTTSDLAVSAGSGLSVNVSGAAQGSTGGNAWLPGGYRFYNDSVQNIVLSAANATYPRIDLIVACVDTSTNPYTPIIKAITGTPASSPTVPSVPGTLVYIPLAQIYVAANATTLSAGNITDVRTLASIIPLVAHMADETTHIPYAVATGSANTYAVTLSPAPTAYTDGMAVCVKINAASTGASTLNVNGLGAKAIKDSLGNAITSGGLKTNTPYTLRYESTSGSFIVQGKGGGGNTIASHILAGETATVDIGQIIGTMVNHTGVDSPCNSIAGTSTGMIYVRPQVGYYSGSEASTYSDANFTASNIVSGKSIFGLGGSATIESLGGKNYATGNITASSSGTFTVSGLSFQPKSVVFYSYNSSTSAYCVYGYSDSISRQNSNQAKAMGVYNSGFGGSGSYINSITLNSNGFTVDGNTGYTMLQNASVNWIAFS